MVSNTDPVETTNPVDTECDPQENSPLVPEDEIHDESLERRVSRHPSQSNLDEFFDRGSNAGSRNFDVASRVLSVVPSTPDVNQYQQKKTLAQGLMDLALISANANQLRYVLEASQWHPYYYFSLCLIIISITIQIAVGVGLIMNSQCDIKCDHGMNHANRINNITMILIFLLTFVNVFITAFGVPEFPVTTDTQVKLKH